MSVVDTTVQLVSWLQGCMNLLRYPSTPLIFLGKILNRWSYSFRHSERYLHLLICEWYTFNEIPAETFPSHHHSFLSVQELIFDQNGEWAPNWSSLGALSCFKDAFKDLACRCLQISSVNAGSYQLWKLGESSHTTSFAYSSDSIYQASSHLGLKAWLRPMWKSISRSSWVLIIILHQMSGSS